MSEYPYTRRAEFTAIMQRELVRIADDLDALTARLEKAGAAAKLDAERKLQVLHDRAAGLRKQLDQAKAASESTWEEIKAGFRKGRSDLESGFNELRQWASEKIAP